MSKGNSYPNALKNSLKIDFELQSNDLLGISYLKAIDKINPKTTIFAGANFDKTTQQIRIGGFNEQTENYNTIGAFIGLMLKNKGKISVGYSGKTDFLNSTRDRGIFTIGGSINL